jgi:hypothetical protein
VHRPDWDRFRTLLNNLAAIYGKKPPEDGLLQAYWQALRDLPIELVEQAAAYHQRYGKHFPRPVELRPRDDKPGGAPESRNTLDDGERLAERWRERATASGDPLALAALQDAAWARRLATTDESHPAYRETMRMARLAADRHMALLTGRPMLVRVK